MPDLTAGCQTLAASASTISCSRLRCAVNSYQLRRVQRSSIHLLRVNNSLMDLVNARLDFSVVLIGTTHGEYSLQFQRLARRRLSGCVVIWRVGEHGAGQPQRFSFLPLLLLLV